MRGRIMRVHAYDAHVRILSFPDSTRLSRRRKSPVGRAPIPARDARVKESSGGLHIFSLSILSYTLS